MAWRLDNALVTLRNQVNTKYPNRSKISDGTIGDSAHASRPSDHNPDARGVVKAFDITHDPGHGLDIWTLANTIKNDSRVSYLIANRQIYINGRWSAYSGSNPHVKHLHVSVKPTDNGNQWNLGSTINTGGEMTTATDLDRIYLAFYDTHPDEQAKKDYIGKSLSQTLHIIFDGPGYKAYEAKRREAVSEYPKIKEKVKELEGKLVLTSQELEDTREAGEKYIKETNKQIQLLENKIKQLEDKPTQPKPPAKPDVVGDFIDKIIDSILNLWRSK